MPRKENTIVKFKWLVVLGLFFIAGQPCFADDRAQIVGAWKLVSWEREIQKSGKRILFFGKKPTGSLVFTPEGRVTEIVTAEGRTAPTTEQERAALLNSMVALAGTYRVEGDRYIRKFDVAWHPERVGIETVSTFRLEGNRLHVIGDWTPATVPGKSSTMGRTIATWERVK